jgi:DNA-binding GntR family transcriptional regulator
MKTQEQHAQAYQLLYQDLVSGALKAGEAINIDALKRLYQLSAAPIREALKQLLPSGMVTFTPNKGFRCTELTQQQFEEIYNCRMLVEKEGLRLAIKQSSDDHKGELLADQFKLGRLCTLKIHNKNHKNSMQFLQAYKNCYLNLFNPIKNSTIYQLITTLYQQSERYNFQILRNATQPQRLLQQNNKNHKQLVDAVIAGQVTTATKQIHNSLQKTAKYSATKFLNR